MEKQKRKNEAAPPFFLRLLGAIFGGIWKGIRGIASGAWWLLKNGAKAIWVLLQRIWYGSGWLLKLPYRLLRYLISGRVPQFENLRQEEIFWRIKRQYRRKRLFAFHMMAFIMGILFSIGLTINQYFHIQELMRRTDGYNYWAMFNQTVASIAIGLGIWTVLLIFHFAFNRMGNEEDVALGKALEPEYARSDYQEERYQRLREPFIEDDEDYEAKPKRNGAKS
jgi:hypothetical protein